MPIPTPKAPTSFQRRLTIGFATTVAVTALIAIASTFLLHDVITNKDLVIYDYGQDLILTERLRYFAEKKISMYRGYFLTREPSYLEGMPIQKKAFIDTVEQLKSTASPPEIRDLDELVRLSEDYDAANERVIDRMRSGEGLPAVLADLIRNVRPFRQNFERKLSQLVEIDSKALEAAKAASIQNAKRSFILIAVITTIALALAAILAFVLSRTLNGLYQSALRATRLREEVLGIVAHDLKNPIASIRMSASSVKRSLGATSDGQRIPPIMDRIDRVTQQMQRLIEDLLIADKIEAGIFTLDFKKENLKEILSDVVEQARPLAEEKDVKFVTHFSQNLGAMMCDRHRLMQVFSNLLGNAIKFTPNGGVVSFEVTAFKTDVVFVVKDTGPGIPTDQIPRLFDRRWQAQATSQKGNGLGLYIAKNIVKTHRGQILVTSHPGHGTTFEVQLPRQPQLNASSRNVKPTVEL